ncbi:FAD-binding oxidoreductase [Nocardia sp. CDC159]|uniref:FAD-binding oxidoreductase n=1 Tax=Nocardia pulmonis TaxID=2951408 RepID=A0A9X2IU75_9NOCA|nr:MULTISPECIES: FAD-binding oxidoreductase [Nocardia]MCM6772582.1 FAD-binding oxidoreductase [Nocardia pulmonis]MCM6784760.1 FAD-binding oxidoreductase [Nocardia sp. CDC159]
MSGSASSIGRVVTPDSPDYDAARKGWNDRHQSRPREIIYCASAPEVAAAVGYAREQAVPFRVRSGGHSTEGYSSVEGGIVIDVSEINSIELMADNLARIGPGARNYQIGQALWAHGRAVPTGTCSQVAVAGYTLGNGIGLLCRTFGTMSQNVVALEIVDAEGEIRIVDEAHHPDLFWACRGGGGGNFGIVTSFLVRTHPIGDVTMFRLVWPWDRFAATFDAFQRWSPAADSRVNSYYTIQPESVGWVDIGGLFVGTPDELDKELRSLRAATPAPDEQSVQAMPYIDATQVIYDKVGSPEFHRRSRATCLSLGRYTEFDETAVDILARWHSRAFGNIWTWVFAGHHGSTELPAPLDSAEPYGLDIRGDWTDPAEDDTFMAWFEGIYADLRPHFDKAYLNWTDRNIEDRLHMYYAGNFPRLVAVKKRWDPGNVFNFPRSIPPQVTIAEARRQQMPEAQIAQLRTYGCLVE